MIVDLPLLLLALLLLWLPRRWLTRPSWLRRRRAGKNPRIIEPWREREPGDPRVSFRAEFVKVRNYVDLLRGAGGSLLLFGGLGIPAAIAAPAAGAKSLVWQIIGIRAAILVVGVLIQALRRDKDRMVFFPPIFYLGGLSVGLSSPMVAAFAFVLIWAINPAVPSAQVFLTVYAMLIVCFGYYFAWRGDLRVLLAGGLCFLPVLLSLLMKRPMVIFVRKRAHG